MTGPLEAKTTQALDATLGETQVGQFAIRGTPPSFSDNPISPFAYSMILALKSVCQELAAELDRLRAELA